MYVCMYVCVCIRTFVCICGATDVHKDLFMNFLFVKDNQYLLGEFFVLSCATSMPNVGSV